MTGHDQVSPAKGTLAQPVPSRWLASRRGLSKSS